MRMTGGIGFAGIVASGFSARFCPHGRRLRFQVDVVLRIPGNALVSLDFLPGELNADVDAVVVGDVQDAHGHTPLNVGALALLAFLDWKAR